MGTLRWVITVLLVAFTFGVGIVLAVGPKTTDCLKEEFEDANITSGDHAVLRESSPKEYLRIEYEKNKWKRKVHTGSPIGNIDTTNKPLLTWKTKKTTGKAGHKYLLLMVSFEEVRRSEAPTVTFHWIVKNLGFSDLTSEKKKPFVISNTKGKPTEIVKYVKPSKNQKSEKEIYLFLVYEYEPSELDPDEPSDPDPFHPGVEPITLETYLTKTKLKEYSSTAPRNDLVAGNFFTKLK